MTKKQRQKQEKRRKQRVFFSILMILFTGIILTASTYAWFTSNRNVSVREIDVNVSASTGFQISEDAVNWKSIVTGAQLKAISYSMGHNQFPTDIAPTSSVGEVDSTTGFMKMFLGTVADENGTSMLKSELLTEDYTTTDNTTDPPTISNTPVKTSGNFIAFDLYFRASSDAQVYLNKTSTVTVKNSTTDSGIKNAARVAFIVEGNSSYDAAASESQGLVCAGASCAVSSIWEPNSNGHTERAVEHAVNVYGMPEATVRSSASLTYKGLKAAFNNVPVADDTNTTYFGTPTGLFTTTTSYATDAANKPVFQIKSGITKVRVYMWVEGQDVDCEDYAASTDGNTKGLAYNLAFTLDE